MIKNLNKTTGSLRRAHCKSTYPKPAPLTDPLRIMGLLSFLFFYFLSGCATPDMSRQTQLNDDEGILLTKVHVNVKGISLLIYDEGAIGFPKATIADDDYFKIMMIGGLDGTADNPVNYLRAFTIRSGKSYFGKLNGQKGHAELNPHYFNITPGVINYIGDIYINLAPGVWGGTVQTQFIDSEEKTIKEAKEKYFWLFDKYRYVKNMPEVKLDTVPGFNEVKELKELKQKTFSGAKEDNEAAPAK